MHFKSNFIIFTVLILKKFQFSCFDIKGFDDTIQYHIAWGDSRFYGQVLKHKEDLPGDTEIYPLRSNPYEDFECLIPKVANKELDENLDYNGPGPLDLLKPLFLSSACSYRIESYWTYEICHGNYIKQYHEEREGKVLKTQEYFLGKWDKSKTEALRARIEKTDKDNEKLKHKKIDGLNLPYIELEMTDGTICDLNNNEPRTTRVLYVCYGKNEIYSLKETSTCNYEVIVTAPPLCLHPKFRPQETGVNVINCYGTESFRDIPITLIESKLERLKLDYQNLVDSQKNGKETVAVFKVDSKDGTLRMEVIQTNDLNNFNSKTPSLSSSSEQPETETVIKDSERFNKLATKDIKDTSPVDAFLQGKNCLKGGTGWWKYEFCYGRYVRQYHIDKNGEQSLILGFFDEKAHIEFIKSNPHKRPKPVNKRTQLTHFYQSGSLCDKTGKRRQTEVKLKCLENTSSSSTVSLYLLEPQTCQYILGVESPLICDILQKADENGLVPKDNIGSDNDETPAEYIIEL